MRDGCDSDGDIDPAHEGRPWAEVVHLDIKPPNILLGEINGGDPEASQRAGAQKY